VTAVGLVAAGAQTDQSGTTNLVDHTTGAAGLLRSKRPGTPSAETGHLKPGHPTSDPNAAARPQSKAHSSSTS